MAPASAIPAATLSAPSGSTPAPTASSLRRRQPVVTMRSMPQLTRTDRWLAQVMASSDGFPEPSHCWIAQCGPPTCPLPAGPVQSRAAKAHPRTLGQGLNSMALLPTGSTIDADTACRGGKQQSKRHETGVVSRVPRISRHAWACGTDTNTYRTGFTHQQQRTNRKKGATEWKTRLNLARTTCGL